jgi:hypothetical protein
VIVNAKDGEKGWDGRGDKVADLIKERRIGSCRGTICVREGLVSFAERSLYSVPWNVDLEPG